MRRPIRPTTWSDIPWLRSSGTAAVATALLLLCAVPTLAHNGAVAVAAPIEALDT